MSRSGGGSYVVPTGTLALVKAAARCSQRVCGVDVDRWY